MRKRRPLVEQSVTERFRDYVLVDHRARLRNDLLSVGVSISFYAVSIASNVPNADAVRVSLYILVAGVVISTCRHVLAPRKRKSAPINISKRVFLPRFAALAATFAAFAVGVGLFFRIPALQATIIDHRLRESLEGEPTEEKLREARWVVTNANDNGLPASPDLVSRLGAKVANIVQSSTDPSLQRAALSTGLALANYRSSLSKPPQATSLAPLIGNIQVGCIGEPGQRVPILEGVPWVIHLDFRNCSRVSITPQPPMNTLALLPIDSLQARNIVFVDGTFRYDGGAISLESVQFINCRINIVPAHAGNKNVQQFLKAAVTGLPITLSLMPLVGAASNS